MKKVLFLLSLCATYSLNSIAKQSPIEYIEKFKDIAMEEMRNHKVPASITLAQGCLESSYGNSRLATEGNNHFGIKCKSTWKGKVIYEDDDAIGECFRAYDNAASSYKDHSLFLLNNPRYGFLFELSISDYKGWAHGLRKAGYATNPKYPQLLISMVERYNLAKYDTLVLGLFKSSEKINGILATRLKEDQTLAQIAAVNERTERRIRKFNDLEKGQEIDPGDIVYLRRKKRKASEPYHEVLTGQSLWSISQEHGIKLKRIYKLNQINEGDEVSGGQVINLRYKASQAPQLVNDKSNILNEIISKEQKINYQGALDVHYVKSNETLYSIAKQYHTSVDTLKAINNLTSSVISLGQVLKVPKKAVNTSSQKSETAIWHTVAQGETLYSIGKKYKVSIEHIKSLNNMADISISIGQRLRIQ